MADIADGACQIQLLVHICIGVDPTLHHKGIVALLVEVLGHRVALHHVVAVGAAAAGNDDHIALDLVLVAQQVGVQEGAEALVVVADLPALGGQRRFHGHLVAPDLPDGALGILDLAQCLPCLGQCNAHLIVGGIDAGCGCAVHLFVLGAGQFVEQDIELVKIALEGSGVERHLAGSFQLLRHHRLHFGVGVDVVGLGKGCRCDPGRHADRHGRCCGKLHKFSSVHGRFSFHRPFGGDPVQWMPPRGFAANTLLPGSSS